MTTIQAVRRWAAVASVLARASWREPGLSARQVLSALEVEVTVNSSLGLPGGRGTLIVANHVSWLDIIALQAVAPIGFLAKSELRRWPVIGALAARHGTRFIERGQLRGLPAVVDDLAGALRSGRSIAVFPEGTTWCGKAGHEGGRFRRAAFQAALDAAAPIQPVIFEYRQGTEPTTVASFVGDDTLLASLRRVAQARDLRIQITAQPALDAVGDRRELAARAQATIRRGAARV